MRLKIFSILTILSIAFTSCNKVNDNTNIPYAFTSFFINTAISGSDNELSEGMLGNAKIYNKTHPAVSQGGLGSYGYSGVVVVRAYDDNLYAYDLCCTYEVEKSTALQLDGFFLKCPKCGSNFEIGNGLGIPSNGPAKQRLKQYRVYQNAGYMHRVGN